MSRQLIGESIVSAGAELFNDANITHVLQSTFEQELAESTAPDAVPVEYRRAAALLLSWTEDQSRQLPRVRCAHEIEELASLLRNEFHMHVEVFKVPSKSPQLAVNSTVSRFILDNNHEHGLMIIYYGGHGFRKAGTNTKLVLTADDSQVRHLQGGPDPQFDWRSIEHLFDEVDSDVLELLDCCNAGIVARDSAGRHRRHEIFVSCGFSGRSPSAGENSFTTQMIEVIRSMLQKARKENKQGFDTRQLHLELNDRIVQHNKAMLNSNTLNQSPIRFDRSHKKDGPIYLSPFRHQSDRQLIESGQIVPYKLPRSRTRSNSSRSSESCHISISLEFPREPTPEEVRKLAKGIGNLQNSLKDAYVPIDGVYWSGLHKGSADSLSHRWRRAISLVLWQARSQKASNTSGPPTPNSMRSLTPDFSVFPDSQSSILLSPVMTPDGELNRRLSNSSRSWNGRKSPSRSRSRGRVPPGKSQSLDLGISLSRSTQTDFEARSSSDEITGSNQILDPRESITIQPLKIPDTCYLIVGTLVFLLCILSAVSLRLFLELRQYSS